ncbi:hypothetical protein HYALB_00011325 [Hymenoscyphus albidus]|uniref:Uncharacterized protein n=1 Tax=Hymenoscyphus albidus TaxID=595503 RepID=A0A9N9LDC0_9HELO|nr:hypothetical protein HYALB_00011325 [Hymenoscyphus albidus]
MCSFHVIDVNNFGGCVKRKVTSAKKPQSPQAKRKRVDEDRDYAFAEPVKTVPPSSRPTAYAGTSKSLSRKLEDQKKIVVQQKRPGASKSLLAQTIDAADEDKLWSVILDLCQNIPNATDIVIKNLARTISTDTIHVDNRGASNKQQRLYTTPQLERLLKETIPLPKKAETNLNQNQQRKGIDDGEATYKRRAVPVEEDAEAPLCEVCGKLWR